MEDRVPSATRFVTVTLSPTFERTLVTNFLAAGYQNQTVKPERLDPSGQGVNIARALHGLDCETHAVLLLGNDLTGHAYRALLTEEGLRFTSVYVEGPTCSRTCILDMGNDQETLITTEGAKITEFDVQRLANTLEAIVREKDTVVLTGPLPPRAPGDSYARLIETVHAAGAEAVLVAVGPALKRAPVARPEMVALTRLQCESFYNVPIGAEFGSPDEVEEHRVDVDVRAIDEGEGSSGLVPGQSGS